MGDKLRPGRLDTWKDAQDPLVASMARQMEIELNRLLDRDGLPPLVDDDAQARDMRRLFLAIARGVCKHLQDNPAAFRVQALNTTLPLARIDADLSEPP